MTPLSGDRTHHTCLLLLNTYSLLMMALPHYYARLWKIIILMPLHHTLSNLVTSTLVTIFCRLQKTFQNKILTIDINFHIMCCEILLNFIPTDYFECPTILLKGALTGSENCVDSNKHFVAGWIEMNSVSDLILQIEDSRGKHIFGKYLFPVPLILSLTDRCYWFIRQEMSPHNRPRSDEMQKWGR